VRLEERRGLSLVQVMAHRGKWPAVEAAAESLFKAKPPARPAALFADRATLVWSGPGQFLILGAGDGFADPLAPYAQAFREAASLSDQSDGRALIRVSGRHARDTLAKVSSLDLHPAVFPVGAAAATSVDHTNVGLWRAPDAADGAPVFDLLVFRSFAPSLWERLAASGAEYGVDSAAGDFSEAA
jgi:sarcosine oxidase subunit gamma